MENIDEKLNNIETPNNKVNQQIDEGIVYIESMGNIISVKKEEIMGDINFCREKNKVSNFDENNDDTQSELEDILLEDDVEPLQDKTEETEETEKDNGFSLEEFINEVNKLNEESDFSKLEFESKQNIHTKMRGEGYDEESGDDAESDYLSELESIIKQLDENYENFAEDDLSDNSEEENEEKESIVEFENSEEVKIDESNQNCEKIKLDENIEDLIVRDEIPEDEIAEDETIANNTESDFIEDEVIDEEIKKEILEIISKNLEEDLIENQTENQLENEEDNELKQTLPQVQKKTDGIILTEFNFDKTDEEKGENEKLSNLDNAKEYKPFSLFDKYTKNSEYDKEDVSKFLKQVNGIKILNVGYCKFLENKQIDSINESTEEQCYSEKNIIDFFNANGGVMASVSIDGTMRSLEIDNEINDVDEIIDFLNEEKTFEKVSLGEFGFANTLNSNVKEEKTEEIEPFIDGIYVPSNEVYLKQAHTEPRVKLTYILSKIFSLLLVATICVGVCYISYIVKSEDFIKKGATYGKNLLIIVACIILTVTIRKFFYKRFNARILQIYKMNKDKNYYKPLGNHLCGEKYIARVRSTKDYLFIDLIKDFCLLAMIIAFCLPFTTVNNVRYSLLQISLNGVIKLMGFVKNLILIFFGSATASDLKDISSIYSQGAISIMQNFVKTTFKSMSINNVMIFCTFASFVIILFIVIMLFILVDRIYNQVLGIINARSRIDNQKIAYKNNDFKYNIVIVSVIAKYLFYAISILTALILFFGITIKNIKFCISLPLIIVLIALIIIIVLDVLKVVLFKDKSILDSGLWFFDRYRLVLRFKYKNDIKKFATETQMDRYDEYSKEQERIKEEELDNTEEYRRSKKIKRIFFTVLAVLVVGFVSYVTCAFLDMFGFFHTGKYEYLRNDSITVETSESYTLKKNGKMIVSGKSEFKEFSYTYKIFGEDIYVYLNNSLEFTGKIKDNAIYLEVNIDNFETENDDVTKTYIVYKKNTSKFKAKIMKGYSKIRKIYKPVTKVLKFMTFTE